MEKLAKMNADKQQAKTKVEPEVQSVDQQAKDGEQEAPSSIPYVHTCQS